VPWAESARLATVVGELLEVGDRSLPLASCGVVLGQGIDQAADAVADLEREMGRRGAGQRPDVLDRDLVRGIEQVGMLGFAHAGGNPILVPLTAAHAGHEHAHAISSESDRGRLIIALALILGLMTAEVVVGIIANSLALLSDAGHMLTDAAALSLSLVALRLAQRPAEGRMTFGLRRAEILSAQANGITLLVLAGLILFEAIRRLVSPPEVEAGLVLIVALVGIAVNLVATLTLAGGDRRSLNVEGSFQHILTDLYAFAGTAIAAAAILITDFQRADPIASLFVAGLMLHSAYRLLRDSGRVFLEASPRGLDPEAIGRKMAGHPGVVEVHDLHLWEVTSGFPSLSAHVTVDAASDGDRVRLELADLLERSYGIGHSTLQVEQRQERLLKIEPGSTPRGA
jgi:cobalt-zinc-cadmium efflux system protein